MTHNLEYKNPTPNTLCLYAEFLAQKLASPKSVRNYLSAIVTYHNYLGLQAPALSNFQYQLMLRALPLTMRHFPSQKLPITPDIMCKICLVCDGLGAIGAILKVAFTLGFFGFLRQSNLPHPAPSALMPLATPRAVTSLCSPAAYWCALNGARRTKPPANQPSFPSPASQVNALIPWPPTLVCCVQSPPTTPVTPCSCHPSAA